MTTATKRRSPPGQPTREFELKLEVSREVLERLRRVEDVPGWVLGRPVKSSLRSVYFDTPDYRLHKNGISLRVRSDGDRFTQTVKRDITVANGVSSPIESEAPLEGPDPDVDLIVESELRRELKSIIRKWPLAAIFETDIERSTRPFHNKKLTLELALDDGVIRAGPHEVEITEAELELKSGARLDMIAAAEALFAGHPFRLSPMSKASRGYAISSGREHPAPASVGYEAPDYNRDESCQSVLRKLVAAASRQIVGNHHIILETDEPEGPHQMRVGLRRLRAILRAFEPLLDEAAQRLNRHCIAVGRSVGALRDADVLWHDISLPVKGTAFEADGYDELEAILSSHRSEKRDEVRAMLGGTEFRALQLELALWPQALDENRLLDTPIADLASISLDRAWKRVEKRGRNVARLTISERHDLRKSVKNLRYAVECFASLYPERAVKPFIKRLKSLQEIFGYLNDASTAANLIAITRERCKGDAACHGASGFILGWHTANADARWKDAQTEWQELKATEKFWR